MKTKAVVFDLDGVLVDSEPYWHEVESSFLRGLIPTWSDDDQRGVLGLSIFDVHAKLVAEYDLSLSRSEYIAFYETLVDDIYGTKVVLTAGVTDLLAELQRAEIPVAIASSSNRSWIEIVVKRFSLSPPVLHWVGADDVGGVGKPAPDVYLAAAEKLGVLPTECVAIEDTEKGLRSALAAGYRCFGFRNGYNDHQNLSSAESEFSCFIELPFGQLLRTTLK